MFHLYYQRPSIFQSTSELSLIWAQQKITSSERKMVTNSKGNWSQKNLNSSQPNLAMSKKSYTARSSILFSSNHTKSAPLQSQLQNQATTQKMILAAARGEGRNFSGGFPVPGSRCPDAGVWGCSRWEGLAVININFCLKFVLTQSKDVLILYDTSDSL